MTGHKTFFVHTEQRPQTHLPPTPTKPLKKDSPSKRPSITSTKAKEGKFVLQKCDRKIQGEEAIPVSLLSDEQQLEKRETHQLSEAAFVTTYDVAWDRPPRSTHEGFDINLGRTNSEI